MLHYIEIMDINTLHIFWEGFMEFIHSVGDGIDIYNVIRDVIGFFSFAYLLFQKNAYCGFSWT